MCKRLFGDILTTNCQLYILMLLLTLRLRGVIVSWTETGPHYMGVTWSKRIVHFKRMRGTPRVFSLWFKGRGEIMPAYYLNDIKRKVVIGL